MKNHLLLTLSFVVLFTGIMVGASFAQDCWVAVAYNNGKRVFAVENGPTLWDAQKAAMKAAGMPGAAIWSWRQGGCLAVAIDQNNPGTFGMSGGDTPQEAESGALDFCKKMGGKNCKVQVKDCCR